MRYYEGRFLIYDSISKFKASAMTEESLEMLGGTDAVAIKVHEATDLLLPFMKQKALSDPNNFNIPKWFESMIQNSDKKDMAVKGITKRLTEANIEFTPEDVETIVNVPLELHAQRSSSVSAKLLEYTTGDMQATTKMRRRVMVDDAPYKHPNVTVNQTVNSDPLGVRLPDADIIVSHTIGEPYADTPFQDTYTPYPNRLYRMKQIVSILTSATPQIRQENINRTIEMLAKVYEIKIEDIEARKLRSNFQLLPLDHVVGNPDNDTVEILPNEQNYYENLVEFIRYHILKFNKEVMVNATEDEIKIKSEQDFNNGVLPVRLTEYLDTLLFDVLNGNFYHTGNFNFMVGDLDSPEEEGSSKDAANDTMNMIMAKDDPRQSDLNVVASSYLGLSARTFTAAVWAEGIVKLMRWGDRKVKNLNVGVNNTQYLDLQGMNLITQQLADLSQFEVDQDEQGRTLDVLAYSYCDFKPEGSKRAKSYPFLLVGSEYGYVPGVEESISVTYITTLFDIVKSYREGNPTVYDLSLVDGKFVDESKRADMLNIDLEELRKGNRKIKISEELIDYAVDNNITKMQGTAFSLMRQEELEDYASNEPLMERLAETPKPMRSNLVQGGLLSVFQENADNNDTTNLAQLLNWYNEEVYPTHLEGYNKLFGFTTQDAEASKINVKNLKTSHFFEPKEVEEQEEIVEFMYPIYEGPELEFGKVIRNGKDDTVIGAYAVTPEGVRVFAATDEIKEFSISVATVQTGQILLNLYEVMLSADTKNNYKSKHKVVSENSAIGIYKGLANIK